MSQPNKLKNQLVLLGLALGTAPVAVAEAQGFQLDQFRAAETSNDGFAISSPNDLGHLDFGARLSLDYGLNPLVYEATIGHADTERYPVVEHMLTANVGLSLGLFDRVVIYAGLPATLFSTGSDMAPVSSRADGTQVGDPYLGARVRLFGERTDVFALGLQLGVTFPLGDATSPSQTFTGERAVTFVPRLMGELRVADNRLRIGLNVGARVRESTDLLALRVGHELTYGLGITGVLVPDVLDLLVEAYGATGFETLNGNGGFAGRDSSPLEVIGGLRVHPICEMEIGLAGGAGIARGYGAPDFRGVFQIGYAHDPHCRVAEPVVVEPPPVPDTDGDGLLDPDDQCPTEPEDVDTFEDQNGCPDPDNDQDGVLDVNDGAPMDPEDRDGFQDEDGVPDPDNDQDGVLDADDRCPIEAEDRDGFQDEDGCPENDNDQDTVIDPHDNCPLAPGLPENNGCPRTIRLDTETGTIVILQLVEFATNRDVILDRSFPILEEVRAVLAANPQITRVRIEGHTDDRGRDAANLDLSRRRAASVLRWLTEHGIDVGRMEAWGCGELHPTETNTTAEGRQRNRRVEFHIIAPAPASGPRQLEGCVQADAARPQDGAPPPPRRRRAAAPAATP
ncbi:MAG: OmpA family protein [Sandaracinaceae bacterium]|nr:OmpA family protein [Sandaracinaceae bacterium]